MNARNPKHESRRQLEAPNSNRRHLAFRISDFGFPSAFGFRLSDLSS